VSSPPAFRFALLASFSGPRAGTFGVAHDAKHEDALAKMRRANFLRAEHAARNAVAEPFEIPKDFPQSH
jgi:hypothetical protein